MAPAIDTDQSAQGGPDSASRPCAQRRIARILLVAYAGALFGILVGSCGGTAPSRSSSTVSIPQLSAVAGTATSSTVTHGTVSVLSSTTAESSTETASTATSTSSSPTQVLETTATTTPPTGSPTSARPQSSTGPSTP